MAGTKGSGGDGEEALASQYRSGARSALWQAGWGIHGKGTPWGFIRWAPRNWRNCSRRLCSAWQPRGGSVRWL